MCRFGTTVCATCKMASCPAAQDTHRDGLCPLPVQPSSNTISRGVCLKAQTKVQVAALLDGATPLHCAALRANPELVQLLLSFKAQPLVTSAAGDMPIQLVPMCRGKDKGEGTG